MVTGVNTLPDHLLAALLTDDVPSGDLTTHTLGIGARSAALTFFARDAMTISGAEEALRLFELTGARARLNAASGERCAAGDQLLEAEGSAEALHRAWKTAQTLMEWASGIATATRAIVDAAATATATRDLVPVACTRKNAPGTKALAAKAVRDGGAIMHRLGLSESLLVFAEHRLFLDEAPAVTIGRLKRAQPEKKVVVEVSSLQEAMLWAGAGADVLQLERFSPAMVAECRAALGDGARPLVAAAGGVKADNAARYVDAGADLLVTSAPYSAEPRNIRVVFRASALITEQAG
jgi:molybdenum transport protein